MLTVGITVIKRFGELEVLNRDKEWIYNTTGKPTAVIQGFYREARKMIKGEYNTL
jgi:hypothetical protein